MEHDICRERLEAIRNHPLYQSSLRRLNDLERGRIFCRHGMEHLLDTARIAYIKSLERALPLSRDLIYAAALLHDIGKWEQYEKWHAARPQSYFLLFLLKNRPPSGYDKSGFHHQ